MKDIDSATKADVDFINQLIPPTKGVDAGSGIHILIPENWSDLVANGVDVPGCTYAKIDSDGTLAVDSVIEQKLNDSQKLSSDQKQKALDLKSRIITKSAISIEIADKIKSK